MKEHLMVLAIITGLSACANVQSDKVSAEHLEVQHKCTDPRPQICTREYMPVCAVVISAKVDESEKVDKNDTGIELKTYATGCTACADPKVLGYQDEACK